MELYKNKPAILTKWLLNDMDSMKLTYATGPKKLALLLMSTSSSAHSSSVVLLTETRAPRVNSATYRLQFTSESKTPPAVLLLHPGHLQNDPDGSTH